jgi:hypothetical protein
MLSMNIVPAIRRIVSESGTAYSDRFGIGSYFSVKESACVLQGGRWGAMMAFFSVREAANVDAKTAFAAMFLKVGALACSCVTLVPAAIILCWQTEAWIRTGAWGSFPISRVLALAGYDEAPANHATTGIQMIVDQGLDLPASGFLLVVAAVLIGFSVFAASVEEQFGKR